MRRLNRLLAEGALVGMAGLVFGLTANFVSPKGLALGRDYFPGGGHLPGPGHSISNALPSQSNTNQNSLSNEVAQAVARLKEKGLQSVNDQRAAELHADPGYALQRIVFIDARDDKHYEQGHIPGAFQFDHYRADNYFPTVLPVCLTAETIVVYCNGGNCEDSEFAAVTLHQAGVPKEKLFVYVGGMTEWERKGRPVELASRGSGNFRPTQP